MKKLLLLPVIISFQIAAAQNVGIGTTTPDASAQLEITSTVKGMLIPRMTQAQRNAITSPAKGLLVYQTDLDSGFFYNAGSPSTANWISLQSQLTGWATKGNSGTNPSTNFIGTTDAQPLQFKVYNYKAGFLDSVSFNTGYGFRTFDSITTGIHNTAVGYKAFISNTTGNRNVALGSNVLRYNTTGNYNVGLGMQALSINTTGTSNVAVGQNALGWNTTRSNLVAVGDSALFRSGITATLPTEAVGNTAVGSKSLYSNEKGSKNTSVGFQSMYGNNTGSRNTALGWQALVVNSSGSDNTALGSEALYVNNGTFNTAIGSEAMILNTTGSYNTAIGGYALGFNTTGYSNTAVGLQSMYSLTSGFYNTAVGQESLESQKSGQRNTAIGFAALFSDTSIGYNTAVGAFSLNRNTTGSNNTAVGNLAMYSNTTGIGNTAVGNQSMSNNTTGTQNTAMGQSALWMNTGSFNTAVGSISMSQNTTGVSNSASGYASLNHNTTGSFNTAHGQSALNFNETGNNNTATGYRSLFNNITGYSNVAIGTLALYNNTDRSNLVAVGDSALYKNGIGAISSYQAVFNTAIGSKALYSNTTGYENTALGHTSLYSNSTGFNNTAIGRSVLYFNTTGQANTANGYGSLYSNITGSYNTGIGTSALFYNTTGISNTAVGTSANQNVTTGNYNTGLGTQALLTNATGSYNTGLGYYANVGSDGLTNSTAVGTQARVDCSNCMVLGSVNGINGASSNVKVGIGNVNPSLAGLVADTKVGAVNAMFGSNTAGVAIESDWPGIGFNTYYDNGRKAIADGFGGQIFVDRTSGGMGLYVTSVPYSTGAGVVMNSAMTIKPNGNVGIGTTNPVEKLGIVSADNNSVTNIGAFYPNNLTQGIGIGYDEIRKIGTNAIGNLFMNAKGNGDLILQNSATGNVGIGLITPQQKLSISDGLNIDQSNLNNGTLNNNVLRFGSNSGEAIGSPRSGSTNLFGLEFWTGSNRRMVITNAGFVGIGTSNPGAPLCVNGNIAYTAYLGACSDIRYKKDLVPFDHPLHALQKLNGFYYHWKKNEFPDMEFNDQRQIGFSAQEVEKLFPEVVMTDDKGYKSVDYGRLTPVLVEAIKEQQQQINEQQNQIDEFKKNELQQTLRINNMEKEITELKTLLKKMLKE